MSEKRDSIRQDIGCLTLTVVILGAAIFWRLGDIRHAVEKSHEQKNRPAEKTSDHPVER